VLIATFNDLETVERRFKENPNEVAAIILEPIMMNVGLCMPQKGFLEGLRALCDKYGALLIFDEVKTGAKLCWAELGVLWRRSGYDLPGKVDWRRVSAGGVWRAQAGDEPNRRSQSVPRRHLQYKPDFDGCGDCDVPRSADSGELYAYRQAQ